MMRYFNFDNLINKYSCTFKVLTETQAYDERGDKVSSISERNCRGAIISITETRIYKSDGILTERDKDLFMTESLGDIEKVKVVYEGNEYAVQTHPQNNHQFTGVFHYTLKWVSAFKVGESYA